MTIEVTPADRDRAANAVKAYRDNKNGNWQKRIRDGECDEGEMVQSFARHRIEAQRPLLEALIIALDSMESVDGENDCSRGIKSAKAAIKQVKGE